MSIIIVLVLVIVALIVTIGYILWEYDKLSEVNDKEIKDVNIQMRLNQEAFNKLHDYFTENGYDSMAEVIRKAVDKFLEEN